MASFASVQVAEDSVYLPWIDLVREATVSRGGLKRISVKQGAFHNHAVALGKATATDQNGLPSAHRMFWIEGNHKRLKFENGVSFSLTGPRNYQIGSIRFHSSSGNTISTQDSSRRDPIKLTLDGSRLLGFSIGELRTSLEQPETKLVGEVKETDSVISLMHPLKRVGLRRLLVAAFKGGAGYSVSHAENDVEVLRGRGFPGRQFWVP
ncbi:hypothetical protein N8964_00680 [Pontimonas sp.]|nr:hypothetical protein [Pontimonas sp.]